MIIDIINKKRKGESLTKEELEYAFTGYQKGLVKDYQMSALLMAICINDMKEEEIFHLTDIFLHSGDILDLSFLDGVKVDKHSTGGVGDKTTLILGPIIASLQIPFIKMSGRSLGFTGGTIDKLESIPGFRVDLSLDEIKKQAKEIGLVVTSQTENLTPLDKMVYALRDVTGTTESIPLIASSIMSKKIAGGADKIVIDVKVGEGALLKTEEDAKRLSDLLIKIGKKYGKETRTIFSSMDSPLGNAIGNKVEVIEAMKVLQGKEKGDLFDTVLELGSNLVAMAKGVTEVEAKKMIKDVIENGKAYQKFVEFVTYQGGSLENFTVHAKKIELKAEQDGVLEEIHALSCAKYVFSLGAGRSEKKDKIDYDAGLVLVKKEKEYVKKGDTIAYVYTNKEDFNENCKGMFKIS